MVNNVLPISSLKPIALKKIACALCMARYCQPSLNECKYKLTVSHSFRSRMWSGMILCLCIWMSGVRVRLWRMRSWLMIQV